MKESPSSKSRDSGGTGIFLVAIMVIQFVMMGFTVVSPAMATFSEHFVGEDVTYISTLPLLLVVFSTAFGAFTLGKVIKYKTMSIIANVLCVVFGMLPIFIDNFMLLLVCRAGWGFGIGLLAPIGQALLMANYEGNQLAKYLGYGTFFSSAGGMVFQLIGGFFADISWNLTFMGYSLYIVSLVMSFFLKEPVFKESEDSLAKDQIAKNTVSTNKPKLSKMVWIPTIVIALSNLAIYPLQINLSTIYLERGIGTASVASTSLSLYTLSGALAGLLFGTLMKKSTRIPIPLGFASAAIGALLVWIETGSYIVPTIGACLAGFGFFCAAPALYSWGGLVTPKSTLGSANSLMKAGLYFGAFLSTYSLMAFDSIFGDRVYTPLIAMAIYYVVMAVIFIIYCPFTQKSKQNS